MHLQVREDQVNALTQFMSVTGVYNTYRFGVLQNYFEREFKPSSDDIVRYVELYEQYQGLKEQDNPKLEDKMKDIMCFLR